MKTTRNNQKQPNLRGEGLYRKKVSSWRSIYLREDFSSQHNSIFLDDLSYNLCYDNQLIYR